MQSLESTSDSQKKPIKPERLEYLDQLAIEFQTSRSKDAKEQVLANLANFAFDPSNYDHFRALNILDLFLNNLTNSDENIIKYSVGGLCNLCLDPINKKYIFENGLTKLVNLFNQGNEDIIISIITILMFLVTPESKAEITKESIIQSMLVLSKNKNIRIQNLAKIFLEDYCTDEQIQKALHSASELEDILLPSSEES